MHIFSRLKFTYLKSFRCCIFLPYVTDFDILKKLEMEDGRELRTFPDSKLVTSGGNISVCKQKHLCFNIVSYLKTFRYSEFKT